MTKQIHENSVASAKSSLLDHFNRYATVQQIMALNTEVL